MSKDVKIKWATIRVPETIVVDGRKYPRTQRNLDVVREWEKTKDDATLDKLSDIVLDFGLGEDK